MLLCITIYDILAPSSAFKLSNPSLPALMAEFAIALSIASMSKAVRPHDSGCLACWQKCFASLTLN